MLESDNVGIFLWSARWDWEKSRSNGERQGLGMYHHFSVNDAATVVERARQGVIGSSRSQEDMIGALKRSSPIPTVTPGRLCRLQSKLPICHLSLAQTGCRR
jgi:hypothetical protein